MKRCRHHGRVTRYWPQSQPCGETFEIKECTRCGEWLPLGPANDAPAEVQIEIRAAEIAAVLNVPNEGLIMLTSFHERRGLWLHAQAERGKAWGGSHDCGEQAGYLARAIVTHDEPVTTRAEEGAVMTIDLDYVEWLSKLVIGNADSPNFVFGPLDQKRLARAVLALLPVVRAAEEWRDSHAWGQGELATAIDEFRRVMGAE